MIGVAVRAPEPTLWQFEATPKCHWLAHLGDQLRRLQVLLDTLVTERLMRRMKQCARPIANTAAFELSTISAIYEAHCAASVHDDLLLGDGEFASACRSLGRHISRGHIMRHKTSQGIGAVQLCRRNSGNDDIMLIVAVRDLVRVADCPSSPFWSTLSHGDSEHAEWSASLCERALGWKEMGDYTLVLPPT